MTVVEFILIQSISITSIGILKSFKMIRANAIPIIIGMPINANLNTLMIGALNKIKVSKHNVPRRSIPPLTNESPNTFNCSILLFTEVVT